MLCTSVRSVRPPRLRCTLFPLIYPSHLLVLPATFGLHLFSQTYPHFRALYVIPVRRTKSLPTASFRFHLAMDTLAVQLYTSSLSRRVWDFHPLERAHGAQTKKTQIRHRICVSVNRLSNLGIYQEVPANDSRGIYCSHHHTVGIYLLFYLLPYCGSQDRLFRLRPAKQLLFPYKSPFRRSAALQLFFTGSELNFLQPSWYLL